MNQLLPQEVVDQIVREERHFSAAPQAFFEAWKRGVEIAGPQWFGDGTREGLNQAKSKWDLRPARGHVPRVSPRPVPSGIRRFPCGCHRPQGLAPFIHRKEPSWPTITTKPPAFSCSTV